MPTFNLGNIVGLIRSETPPTKTYVVWAKILNPSFPDLVELNYYDAVTEAWTPVTDPTTQHWLRPVINNVIITPPVSPSEGDRYLVPTGATGVWAGKVDQITSYKSGNWVFQVPQDGFIVSVRTEANKLYDYRGVYGAGGVWAVNDFQVPIAPGTYLVSTEKGQPLGICDLDSSGKVASSRINGATLPYVPAIPGNWPGGMAAVAAALDHLILNIGGGSGSGVNLTKNIPKTGHGFVVGNVLKINGSGDYVKVTTPTSDKPIGIVITVTDVNNFKIAMSGFISGLSGLTAGLLYHVQATGTLSTTVTKLPYLIALSATEGYILAGAGDVSNLEDVLTAGNDGGALLIKNIGDPVDPQDAATRAWAITYVAAQLAALVDSSPGTLDTLNELAAALGDDPNFATTVTNQLALKAPLASPTLTGTPLSTTAAPGTNTTQIATTAFVAALGALKADLASPTLTGNPLAPTQALGNNTTRLATTEFIQKEIGYYVDLGDVSGAVSVDLSTGRVFKMRAVGNITGFTFTNEVVGKQYTFAIVRETTNYSIVFTAGKWRFPLALPPTLTNPTTNGTSGPPTAIDILSGLCLVSSKIDLVITPDIQSN